MSHRNHAVIVEPERWNRPILELARLLGPMTGAESGTLSEVLERGPVTVEGDLSQSDAEVLYRRLEKLGIPARIETSTTDAGGGSVLAAGPKAAEQTSSRVEKGSTEPPSSAKPRRRQTVVNTRPMAAEGEDSGWGALFPDLASGPSEESNPLPPSLDDLVSEPGLATPRTAPAADAADAVARRRLGTLQGAPLGADQNEATPPLERPHSTHTAPGIAATPSRAEPEPPPKRKAAPAPFDGGALISDLVGDERERPPYAPRGFDGRPEHQPSAAALLSALAPGAGQVFNGDGDRALDYGLKFFLIKPWIDSVRDARTKGEKIATYWAPRPAPGTFASAVRYLLAWWVCVVLTVTLLVWGGELAWNMSKRTPVPEPGPDVAKAVEEAQVKALTARVAGLDAVAAAAQATEDPSAFTMTDAERAERLFSLGYLQCRERNLRMCEQMMKRVSELKPGHGKALKLQAWASLGQRGMRDAPLPDVGEVPSLTELEVRELRQEMALEGEMVPPEAPVEFEPEPLPDDQPSPPSPDGTAAP